MRGFADYTLLVRAGDVLWAASPTTDALVRIDPANGVVTRFPEGTGHRRSPPGPSPTARRAWPLLTPGGPSCAIVDGRTGAVLRTLAAPAYATGVAVDPVRRLAVVAETVENTVRALSLDDGREVWRREVLPDPKPLALTGPTVVVGSQGGGELEVLSLDDGRSLASIGPRPGTPIVGGHTEPHAREVMGGKAPRALGWSARLGEVFVTSIGPNIGPNLQRMEVSMNGGVGVIDPASHRFERHLGFGSGVSEGMALDDETGRLYLADTGLGLVPGAGRGGAGQLRHQRPRCRAVAAANPPAGGVSAGPGRCRLRSERAGRRRALHSGPRALALSAGAPSFMSWTASPPPSRSSRTCGARIRGSHGRSPRGVDRSARARLGQVLYFADMGQQRDELRRLPPRGSRRGHPLREDPPPPHLPEPYRPRHPRDAALLHAGQHVQPRRAPRGWWATGTGT